MTAIDANRMLEPVAADRPCGVDLEYDADFLRMVQASTAKPERQMGSEVLPAEEPNWRDVKQLATRLLARSKDLRVAIPLCRALLHADGFVGFGSGLQIVRGMLEQFWPGLFPLLDADDDNDPTMRVNTLLGLADPAGMLKSLREAPLVNGKVAGSFGLRDIDAAAGRAPAAANAPGQDLIRAAFQEAPLAELEATFTALRQAQQELRGIEAVLNDKLGGRGPDLRPLAAVLDGQARALEQQLGARGGGIAAGATPAGNHSGTPGNMNQNGIQGGIQSREDVQHCIDLICDFYARNEPSSPVPLLLQRARRLVNKNFIDVVRDLLPDGLNQVQLIRGQQETT